MSGPHSWRFGPLTVCMYGRTDGWVRLFGWGLSVERPKHPHDGWVPFSERYGYRKAWHVGNACIQPLRRSPRMRRQPVSAPLSAPPAPGLVSQAPPDVQEGTQR